MVGVLTFSRCEAGSSFIIEGAGGSSVENKTGKHSVARSNGMVCTKAIVNMPAHYCSQT